MHLAEGEASGVDLLDPGGDFTRPGARVEIGRVERLDLVGPVFLGRLDAQDQAAVVARRFDLRRPVGHPDRVGRPVEQDLVEALDVDLGRRRGRGEFRLIGAACGVFGRQGEVPLIRRVDVVRHFGHRARGEGRARCRQRLGLDVPDAPGCAEPDGRIVNGHSIVHQRAELRVDLATGRADQGAGGEPGAAGRVADEVAADVLDLAGRAGQDVGSLAVGARGVPRDDRPADQENAVGSQFDAAALAAAIGVDRPVDQFEAT